MNPEEFVLADMRTEDLQYSMTSFLRWQRRSLDPVYRQACELSIQEIANELARRLTLAEFTLWYTDYEGPPIIPA